MPRSHLEYTELHFAKFLHALDNLPSSGGGGCHAALLGAANHAVRAGLTGEVYLQHVRPNIRGTRQVSDHEILDAFNRAQSDYYKDSDAGNAPSARFAPPPPKVPPLEKRLEVIEHATRDYAGFTVQDLMDASPVQIPASPRESTILTLEALYQPEEFVFLGHSQSRGYVGWDINRCSQWLDRLSRQDSPLAEHIIPNPLTGKSGPKKSGAGTTHRGDSCVSNFRLMVVEFDDIPIDLQPRLFAWMPLPVVALIHSGGKSIHGWIRVDDVSGQASWDKVVRQGHYSKLIPLGADPACQNPSRLSRTPGATRDNGKVQQLLYFAPEGLEVKR